MRLEQVHALEFRVEKLSMENRCLRESLEEKKALIADYNTFMKCFNINVHEIPLAK